MRSLAIITQSNTFSLEKQGCFYIPENNRLKSIPFSNAKSLLGREYPFALYNMQAENGVNFNLEAFAILSGTIQENGTLFLICPQWHNLENEPDFDALRWNENKAVSCPLFYQYFKQLVTKFGFKIDADSLKSPATSGQIFPEFCKFTTEQEHIFQKLPSYSADIHLITAPRGRGKSTLAGLLAKNLAKQNKVLITARSQSALSSFWRSAETQIPFFAPDNLIEQVKNKAISPHQWLFIDEAASLPLPMLHQLCHYFDKVVLTTTTQNYEGTGRGFSLKFLPQLARSNKLWQLTKPLRWAENDPLEQFVNELLLLVETDVKSELVDFYQLLAQAHYKTTATDLRRLFDGENQVLHRAYENNQLIGGIWAMHEGGLDSELTQAIWRGERRPQGSLVAQYLCFQGNLPQACELHSLRISRIAVKPELQHQGIGKQLISDFILQNSAKNRPLDFISVSFGLTAPLYRFWSACGFKIVQISPNKEASSGYRSAMMVYPISEQGKAFCRLAEQAFTRDFGLQPFAMETAADLQNLEKIIPLADDFLSERDWQNLQGFAYGKRTLAACFTSLIRLKKSQPDKLSFLSEIMDNAQLKSVNRSNLNITECRKKIQNYLK